jgi:hypothetical protein
MRSFHRVVLGLFAGFLLGAITVTGAMIWYIESRYGALLRGHPRSRPTPLVQDRARPVSPTRELSQPVSPNREPSQPTQPVESSPQPTPLGVVKPAAPRAVRQTKKAAQSSQSSVDRTKSATPQQTTKMPKTTKTTLSAATSPIPVLPERPTRSLTPLERAERDRQIAMWRKILQNPRRGLFVHWLRLRADEARSLLRVGPMLEMQRLPGSRPSEEYDAIKLIVPHVSATRPTFYGVSLQLWMPAERASLQERWQRYLQSFPMERRPLASSTLRMAYWSLRPPLRYLVVQEENIGALLLFGCHVQLCEPTGMRHLAELIVVRIRHRLQSPAPPRPSPISAPLTPSSRPTKPSVRSFSPPPSTQPPHLPNHRPF